MLLDVIGKGEFGIVYLAKSLIDNKKYAVKCQPKQVVQDNSQYLKLLNTEINIMSKINHPNILHMHNLMESNNNYYMVLDYCNKGDFQNYLRLRQQKYLEEKEAVFFLK